MVETFILSTTLSSTLSSSTNSLLTIYAEGLISHLSKCQYFEFTYVVALSSPHNQ